MADKASRIRAHLPKPSRLMYTFGRNWGRQICQHSMVEQTMKIMKVVLIVSLFYLAFPQKAYAYLDPATGSYVLQIIIAVLVGGEPLADARSRVPVPMTSDGHATPSQPRRRGATKPPPAPRARATSSSPLTGPVGFEPSAFTPARAFLTPPRPAAP